MAKLKKLFNELGIIILYSDTDSFHTNKPIPSYLIGKELGKLKLEHIFDEAVYLAPKVYGGKNKYYEYIKVKGLKNEINLSGFDVTKDKEEIKSLDLKSPLTFEQLKSLLYKNKKLEIFQDK
jgi:hypothetical protein